MNDAPPCTDPRRLVELGGEAGALLREAEPAFERPLIDSNVAWQRLLSQRRRATVWLWGAASAAVVALSWVSIPTARPPVLELELRAEPLPEASPAKPALGERPSSSALEAPPLVAPAEPSSAAPIEKEVALNEEVCRLKANSGKVDRALDCFRSLSRGEGVQAQVALYEAARLSRDNLRDPRRALGLLEEYARRFPEGPLRVEARWLQVQSLDDVGKSDEALALSEQLLTSAAGRTLGAKLRLLRGRIYEDRQSDPARAVSEYAALVGDASPEADESALRRAGCLERLGRYAEARSAYEQYLQRAAPRNPAVARTRLESLVHAEGVTDAAEARP